MTELPALQPRNAVIGTVSGLAGHILVIVGAVVAARVTDSSPDGFADLVAVAVVLLVGEIMVGLSCVIAAVALLVKGRRDVLIGLLGGWLVGLLAVFILIFV